MTEQSHSETVSQMQTRSHGQHWELLSRIAASQEYLHDVKHDIHELNEETRRSREQSKVEASSVGSRIDCGFTIMSQEAAVTASRLEQISDSTASMNLSLIGVRNLGKQIYEFLNSFPAELRGMLRTILQTNMQIYALILQSQRNVPASPTLLLQSNIRFEDGLGVVRELPHEWFRDWEVGAGFSACIRSDRPVDCYQPFEGLLRAHFKEDTPGHQKVAKGQYFIVNVRQPGTLLRRENWRRAVLPGVELLMTMIISNIKISHRMCPRPSCSGLGAAAEHNPSMTIW